MNPPPLHDEPQSLGGGWSITPPYPMAVREEDGATVIWHSPRRLSLWISVYGAAPDTHPEATLDWVRQGRSPDAEDEVQERGGTLIRYGYRLDEGAAAEPSFYGVAIAPDGGYALVGAYFEDAASLADALAAWRSLAWKP